MLTKENLTNNSIFGFEAEKIMEEKTYYQNIEIWDSKEFGKILKLDDKFMTSEKDEFFYHESLVHPVCFAMCNPESALIIGGGDGGVAKQLLKHSSIKKIVIAELDEKVIEVSKKYLYQVHENSFDDKRVSVIIGDGIDYMKQTNEKYDVVFFDLTDIDTPAKELYTKECLEIVSSVLSTNGCMVLHLGAPICFESTHEEVKKVVKSVKDVFRRTAFYGAYVPLYGSYWPMVVASQTLDVKYLSTMAVSRKMKDDFQDLKYYNPQMHANMFAIPQFYLNLVNSIK